MSAQEEVVKMLEAAGWKEAGFTATQKVRIPTTRVPLYGKSGGELATFGGRAKFEKPGTPYRCTVGARTVFFYKPAERKPILRGRGSNVDALDQSYTKDLEHIKEILERLT